MRYAAVIILTLVLVSAATAQIPLPTRGNEYGRGQIVAESSRHVFVQGREYLHQDHSIMSDGYEFRRRVLIYDKAGNFVGYSKLGREKWDDHSRHYSVSSKHGH
jgi:hypothetical protein